MRCESNDGARVMMRGVGGEGEGSGQWEMMKRDKDEEGKSDMESHGASIGAQYPIGCSALKHDLILSIHSSVRNKELTQFQSAI